jgi:hypothetical protein
MQEKQKVTYFKTISEEVGIPYQSLINLYLRYCATSHKKLNLLENSSKRGLNILLPQAITPRATI